MATTPNLAASNPPPPPHARLPRADALTRSGAEPEATPKAEPSAIQPTSEREQIWKNLETLLRNKFHEPDVEAAKVILACASAHRISEYPPVWNMAIAVAGSMKTVILESLDGLPGVHLIDEVTPQTFISGKMDSDGHERKRPASLLHRIGGQGILISADFSTVLTSDQRNRAKVFSQLRRIYDGHLHREFGTDENLDERDWKGRLTFLAGVTPEVDRYHKVFASLGERFIRTRWPRAGGPEAALRAMKQDRQVALDVKAAIHGVMLPILSHPEVASPAFPNSLFNRLASLGEFVALARAYVPRDGKDEIDGEAQPESNTRLPQELSQIGRGWAVLMNRSQVTEEDFRLIRRAAFDSIPPLRCAVLQALMNGEKPHSLGQPSATVDRVLRDLEASGLIRPAATAKNGMGRSKPNRHALTERARALVIAAGEDVQ